MRRLLLCVSGGLAVATAYPVSACTDGSSESHIFQFQPVTHLPRGFTLLKVDAPFDENEIRSLRNGTLPVSVIDVVKGEPAPKKIAIEVSMYTSCDYPGPAGRGLYVVGRFWAGQNGHVDRSPEGLPIFSPILYRQHFFRTVEEEKATALEYETLAAEIETEADQLKQQHLLKLISLAAGGFIFGFIVMSLAMMMRRRSTR